MAYLWCTLVSLALLVLQICHYSQGTDSSEHVQIDKHTLPSGLQAVNGSHSNGGCADINNQTNGLKVCADPNALESGASTKSVLVDGVTSTLDFSDDNWAEGFFTVNRNGNTTIILGFELEPPVNITRVELESLECPDRGIGTSRISLFGVENFNDLFIPPFFGSTTILLDNVTTEATSCAQTHTFHIPMGEQPYRYYYLVFTYSDSDIDWLFLAEVRFLVNTPTLTISRVTQHPTCVIPTTSITPSNYIGLSFVIEPSTSSLVLDISATSTPTPKSSPPSGEESGGGADVNTSTLTTTSVTQPPTSVIPTISVPPSNDIEPSTSSLVLDISATSTPTSKSSPPSGEESGGGADVNTSTLTTTSVTQPPTSVIPTISVPPSNDIAPSTSSLVLDVSATNTLTPKSPPPSGEESGGGADGTIILIVAIIGIAVVIILVLVFIVILIVLIKARRRHQKSQVEKLQSAMLEHKNIEPTSLKITSSQKEYTNGTPAYEPPPISNGRPDSVSKPIYATPKRLHTEDTMLSANGYSEINKPTTLPGYSTIDNQEPDDQGENSEQGIYETVYSEPIKPSLFMHDVSDSAECQEDLHPYAPIYTVPIAPPKDEEKSLEVTGGNICEVRQLGTGAFGDVVLASTVGLSLKDLKMSRTDDDKTNSVLVAVKKLKLSDSSGMQETFEKEQKVMGRLKHENVIRLLGVCMTDTPFLMMEYMEKGDLNQYFQKYKEAVPDGEVIGKDQIATSTLIDMATQIASAMNYLASHNFVHRDLATRNCLVGQNNIIKITDFGMSRKLYDSHYYRIHGRAILPIRWMATECFYGKFSQKTDVWAFGVTMWEIFVLAKTQPYDGIQDQDIIQDAIKGKDRLLLDKPEACPDDVYRIMCKCWKFEPNDRANFEELYTMLSSFNSQ